MTDEILDALVASLRASGLPAVRAYPAARLERAERYVCVGMKSCQAAGSGMGEYLGLRDAGDGSAVTELFGLRLETVVALTLLAPTAAECGLLLDQVSGALGTLPAGFKPRALVCGQVLPDKSAGMFRCEAEVQGVSHLVAQADGETGSFLDFELRGVLKHGIE